MLGTVLGHHQHAVAAPHAVGLQLASQRQRLTEQRAQRDALMRGFDEDMLRRLGRARGQQGVDARGRLPGRGHWAGRSLVTADHSASSRAARSLTRLGAPLQIS